ncbi:hypothetical protein BT69DRAFT_1330674 [Atractiella rhizophila]|nr:hypothetical protein BT69DRAFT_1330674 [Atractiella rhizophila]
MSSSASPEPEAKPESVKKRGKKGKKFVQDKVNILAIFDLTASHQDFMKESLLALASSIVESKEDKIKEKVDKAAPRRERELEASTKSELPKKTRARERLEKAKSKIVERKKQKESGKKTRTVHPAHPEGRKKKAVAFA